MARLTASQRKAMNRSSFALPSKRAYPINDKSHARMALAMGQGQLQRDVLEKR